jgi:hypothetical protein
MEIRDGSLKNQGITMETDTNTMDRSTILMGMYQFTIIPRLNV